MGRDKKNEARTEHFAKLVRSMMETDAWRALPTAAQALYPWLRLEWHGPTSNNNGQIRLSVRQAAKLMGCNMKTAARAFHDLQKKGFIVVTEGARLGLSGEAKSPALELTEIELRHSKNSGGRRLYKEWKVGHDFPVCVASANNPTGRNGKKTCADKGNTVVPISGTRR
ncbi:hypothetical protein [uncultured Sulfitobacter sp.]|uniref:hypothetical protein n=1 Tax=uncultured Sulfitobacter sp. TaxID=191468 RepID=UPI00259806BC|nr:hypothetical protein [uncultured Sulfitobacter sp.]